MIPIKQYEIRDFSGGLFRPSARHLSALQIPENASPDVSNMWARSLGLEKRPVFRSWNDESLDPITGLYAYRKSNGALLHMAWAGGKVYQQGPAGSLSYGGTDWIEIASGFSAGSRVEAATYRDMLIFVNGQDVPQKYAEVTTLDVVGVAVVDENYPGLNGSYEDSGETYNGKPLYVKSDDATVQIRFYTSSLGGRWEFWSTVKEEALFWKQYSFNLQESVVGTYNIWNTDAYELDFNGVNPGGAIVVYVNQAVVTALGGNPPVGRYIIVKDNRIFIAGVDDDRSRLFYCDLGEPEIWDANNFINVNVSDGDVITGLVEWGGNLYIFKSKSIYRLSGTDPSDFYLACVVPDKGAVGQRAIVSTGSGIFFVSMDGVYLFNGGLQCISTDIDSYFRNEIAAADMGGAATAVFDNALYAALPVYGETRVFVYDLLTHGWWLWSSEDTASVTISGAYGGPGYDWSNLNGAYTRQSGTVNGMPYFMRHVTGYAPLYLVFSTSFDRWVVTDMITSLWSCIHRTVAGKRYDPSGHYDSSGGGIRGNIYASLTYAADSPPLLRPTIFMSSLDESGTEVLYFAAQAGSGGQVCSFTAGAYDVDPAVSHLSVLPTCYWQSKDFDFGNPSLYKRFRRLRITGSSLQDRTFNIYFAVDGKQEFTLARTVNLYKASNNITQAKINLPMSARGKTIRLKVESAEAQELRIESIIIEYQEVGIR